MDEAPPWLPPEDDIFVREPDKKWPYVMIVVVCAMAMAVVLVTAFWSAAHPNSSFTYRCEHRGGVVVDNHCIKTESVIKNP